MSDSDRRPLSRLRWGALLVVASMSIGCHAILGPDRVDANWHLFDSIHFTLYARPGSFAAAHEARLGEVLDDQYVTTLAALDVTYGGRISAFLYRDAADAGLGSDHSGVAYAATEALRATVVPPLDGNLFALLQHEANHVIQRNTLGRPGTSFMNEGLASVTLSTRFHDFGTVFLFEWTASRLAAIPPLAALIDDERWTGSQLEYNASASFLAYLLDRGGPSSIKALYQATSAEFSRKAQQLFGATLDDLEREWRAFLAAGRFRQGSSAAAR